MTTSTTSTPRVQNPSYSEAFQSGVREEMTRNPGIFILGTDLQERGGHFAQVKGIAQEFGFDRVKDAPISEAAMVAAGVGAAMYGCHPIVDLNFIDFAFGAMENAEIFRARSMSTLRLHASPPRAQRRHERRERER